MIVHPLLTKVYKAYTDGTTNKFDILFSLTDDDETLLENNTGHMTRTCWSKAAALAIADVVNEEFCDVGIDEDAPDRIKTVLSNAKDAFQRFPWHLPDLVDQAPDLYEAIALQAQCEDPSEHLSKRAFIALCKDVAYD